MQMMEPATMPEFAATKSDKGKPCWYCKGKRPDPSIKNKEDEKPPSPESSAEDGVLENDEKNDASDLGNAIGSKPTWLIAHKLDPEDPIPEGKTSTIVPAAHHLLPGNAAMKRATTLHKYMVWNKDNELGFIGPIGYNINCKQNGIWLPGNYAVRAGTKFGKNWGEYGDDFKNAYARAAMKKRNLQLHDAHPRYNQNVLDTLLDLGGKLDEKRGNAGPKECPVCGEELTTNTKRPPYGLIGRLNLLSREHAKPLRDPEANTKAVRAGYFTSSRAERIYG